MEFKRIKCTNPLIEKVLAAKYFFLKISQITNLFQKKRERESEREPERARERESEREREREKEREGERRRERERKKDI